MSVATAEQQAKGTPQRVLLGDMQIVELVDPSKTYRATLQLGQARRWRQFNGGNIVTKATRPSTGRDGDEIDVDHVPAVHAIGPFSGALMNGLIEAANKWLRANRGQEKPNGLIQRMLYVSDIRETSEFPADNANSRRGPAGGITVEMLDHIIEHTARVTIESVKSSARASK